MRTLEELLDAEFETITPDEWELLKAPGGDGDRPSTSPDLEARIEQMGQGWDRIGEVISQLID